MLELQEVLRDIFTEINIDCRGFLESNIVIISHPHRDHLPLNPAVEVKVPYFVKVPEDIPAPHYYKTFRDKVGKNIITVQWIGRTDAERITGKELKYQHTPWIWLVIKTRHGRKLVYFRGLIIADIHLNEIEVIKAIIETLNPEFVGLPSYGGVEWDEETEKLHGIKKGNDKFKLRDTVAKLASDLKEKSFIVSLDHKGGKPEWADLHLPIIQQRLSDKEE
jgi:hypothetical protein